MLQSFTPAALARRSARHPWLVLAAWVAIVAGGVFAATTMRLDNDGEFKGTDSYRADQLIEKHLTGSEPATETIIVRSQQHTIVDPAFAEFVAGLLGRVRATEGVAAATAYTEGDPGLVSADGHSTILPVTLTGLPDDADETVAPLVELVGASDAAGFEVFTVGNGSIGRELSDAFGEDLAMAERIGIPAALLVLFLVFGAAVAAGVPVVLGLLGIVLSVGLTALASQFLGMDEVVINVITMIGLAVGIDYSLFIIERFREERAKGLPKHAAIARAGETSSRAVLFSGVTVIIALMSLFIIPEATFRGMAVGAVTAVVSAVLIALTLLPALLSLLDGKINWVRLPGLGRVGRHEEHKGFFGHTTDLVIRHPVVSAAAASGVLIALTLPVFAIRLGEPGLAEFPEHLESVRAYHILNQEFSAGVIAPAEVVIDGDVRGPRVTAAIERLRTDLLADGRFDAVEELVANEAGTVGLVNVIVDGDPDSIPAREAIQDLRSDYIPAAFAGTGAEVFVTGHTAGTVDYVDTMVQYLPIIIAFVLLLSFVLLMMVFRSLVIPLKAIAMNLLSVGAAYGLLVLVFQEGVGAELLGFQQTDSITAFLPVFLFAILFGLSMDYHVFLLSRVQERYLQTHDNRGAVAYGLRSTAHIITGAAAIMMVVFAGFAMGDMVMLQQMGFGLAVAVFLDATIVRSVLVPASMELLGSANWYLPSWLGWLPRVTVEGGDRPRTAAGELARMS
ncbi:MAG: MMPL family transporter [Dehalococcoidia bacterium]|nr:MMPL family transporter [Dehalococcoidia bacterium]